MISALSVVDSAMVVVDAVSGFEVGTEIAWDYCDKFELPRFLLINKMNRENADYQKAFRFRSGFLRDAFDRCTTAYWRERQAFSGVVDLLSMKAYMGDGKDRCRYPRDDMKAAAEACPHGSWLKPPRKATILCWKNILKAAN